MATQPFRLGWFGNLTAGSVDVGEPVRHVVGRRLVLARSDQLHVFGPIGVRVLKRLRSGYQHQRGTANESVSVA
jgi:hypothetical protein